jgi:hypothetical protein
MASIMTDDGPIPGKLPQTLSAQELAWLTGLTQSRIGQLASQGVVVRVDRDAYSTASIRRLFEHQRERNIGPSKWNSARSDLATERAAMAKLNRLEREGELMRRDVVREISCGIVAAARDRFLGMPAKLAHRLAVEPKPAGCERILYVQVCEILQDLAGLEVVAERADGQRGKAHSPRR